MNTDIIITRTFTDGRPPQVMKFQPEFHTKQGIWDPPTGADAMNFAALLFCVPMQEPGYDAWAAVERLGLSRHFVDVTPAAEKEAWPAVEKEAQPIPSRVVMMPATAEPCEVNVPIVSEPNGDVTITGIPAPDIMKPHDLDSRALDAMKNPDREV